MRIGIMQPYFFPYPGHFALIHAVDEWVVFDITQYTPKRWMNRNRILHPAQGWQYVTVPLANSSISIRTSEARLLDTRAAKDSILGKLAHYKKTAPHYRAVTDMVAQVFDAVPDDKLVTLNVAALRAVCDYLGIAFSYRIASEMDIAYPPEMGAGDWAPYIAGQCGAEEYLNPESGRALFDAEVFRRQGVTPLFCTFGELRYPVRGYAYEPHLSILDAMMWNTPEAIKQGIIEQCVITP